MVKNIVFTQAQLNQCREFAENINTSYYANRKQTDQEKRKLDQIIGKLGEIATHETLKAKFPDLTLPDFNIYEAKKKSWDFDMKAAGLNLHVKSQSITQGAKYGVSWIFQAQDKHIQDLNIKNQYVSFVSVDMEKKHALVRCIPALEILHTKSLFKAPKLLNLSYNNKLAVYFDDLKLLEEETLWAPLKANA
jgi:hypothetical protein